MFVIVLYLWMGKIMADGFGFLYAINTFLFTKSFFAKEWLCTVLFSCGKNWKLEWNRLMVKTSTSTCLGWPLKPLQGCFICNSPCWPVLLSNVVELEWQLKWLNVISLVVISRYLKQDNVWFSKNLSNLTLALWLYN